MEQIHGYTIVQDDQFWGHWAHTRTGDRGGLYYMSPEVMLGHAKGRVVEASRLRRVFRLRQLTRQVRQHGQIRLHNFGTYVDRSLWGQIIEVLIDDEVLQIEQTDQPLIVMRIIRPPLKNIQLLLSFAMLMMFGILEMGQASQNWDPPAIDVFPDHNEVALHAERLPSMLEAGRKLFVARFNLADGVGRPGATGDSKPTVRRPLLGNAFTRAAGPDANSCAGCHNQPRIGGSGDFAVNVFVGAHFSDPPTQSLSTDVTSERNTISLFGSGAIELLAREMTEDLQAQKTIALQRARVQKQDVTVSLETKGIHFGTIIAKSDGSYDASRLQGVDADLVIKPFGAKGVVISLREFTINALNQHHGIQALERFGWERTGRRDFDEDGVEVEFTVGQTSALTLFQASLPAPMRMPPKDEQQASQLQRGEEAFIQVECASCHIPALPLRSNIFSEPNPYNRPGNLLPEDVLTPILMPLSMNAAREGGIYKGTDGVTYVGAFTDLKRHRICDEQDPFFCNERLRQDFVPTDTFITSKLWDIGSSMPYGHRGDCTTVSEAILHHSGEARASLNAFLQLDDASKRALIRFLLSLSVPTQ